MPNKIFARFKKGGHPTGVRGKHNDKMSMKPERWGGLPGKAQPQNRSGGDRKVQAYAKSEGI